MKTWAVIRDGKVANTLLWDGVTDWPHDDEVTDITAHPHVSIGWDYVDGEFVDNRPKTEDDD